MHLDERFGFLGRNYAPRKASTKAELMAFVKNISNAQAFANQPRGGSQRDSDLLFRARVSFGDVQSRVAAERRAESRERAV